MGKVKRAKRRKIGVWGGGAVLGTAIFGVSVGGNVDGATVKADDGAAATVAALRSETAARDDGANGGFWPRLGSDAVSKTEFNEKNGFKDASRGGVGETGGQNAETTRTCVESADFVGYSVGAGLLERTNAVVGQTRLVGWTEPGAPPSDAASTLESSATKATVATIKTASESGGTAEVGENTGNSETASRPKTPILRDEPVSKAQSGGSLTGVLVSTFGALAVVLGAFFALVALLKRTRPNGGGGNSLEIVDSLAVGDKARLLTIRWGNRLILAAKTPEKIAPLAEIADVDEANAMLAEIKRRKETASTGDVGAKAAAIWKRGRDAAGAWRATLGAKGRRR